MKSIMLSAMVAGCLFSSGSLQALEEGRAARAHTRPGTRYVDFEAAGRISARESQQAWRNVMVNLGVGMLGVTIFGVSGIGGILYIRGAQEEDHHFIVNASKAGMAAGGFLMIASVFRENN